MLRRGSATGHRSASGSVPVLSERRDLSTGGPVRWGDDVAVGSACSDVADAPGRGMNLAGVFDGRNAARGWRVRAKHLDDIAAAGFTTVRLPVCWWGYAQSSYPYRLDGRILDAVEAVLGEAWARDLAVVLTMHHADAVYGDPQGSVDQLVAIGRQIAERFAAATGALAFELLNEPHPPMTPGQWNALLPTVLGGVRDVDANRLVVIGGAEASTVGSLRHLELPPDDHLLATVHYYQPFHFTHQGAPWQVGSAAWLGTGWGSAADRAAVTSDLAEAVAWSQRARVPLYVGEFGALDRADQGSRVRWTHWVRRELDRLGLPWAYWDFGTDFGAYDLGRHTWRQDLLDALTRE